MQFKEPRHNPNKPIIRAIIFTWLHPFLCCFFVSKLFKILLLNGTLQFLFFCKQFSFFLEAWRENTASKWLIFNVLARPSPWLCSLLLLLQKLFKNRQGHSQSQTQLPKSVEILSQKSGSKRLNGLIPIQRHNKFLWYAKKTYQQKKRRPSKPGRESGEQPLFKEFLRTGSRWPV